MLQGHSGSTLRLVDGRVEKVSSCRAFAADRCRQTALQELSQRTNLLPRIVQVDGATIRMEFIRGNEGITERNAPRAGASLRLLHELRGFAYPCITGVDWLVLCANTNLAQADNSLRVSEDLPQHYPNDALIHSEPSQFIETEEGEIVFIDFEEIGQGSRYRDLGFIAYLTVLNSAPETLPLFLSGYQSGYQSSPIELDHWRIRQIAGLTAIAYSGFADTEERLALGIELMEEAERHLGGGALHRASE